MYELDTVPTIKEYLELHDWSGLGTLHETALFKTWLLIMGLWETCYFVNGGSNGV